MFTVYGIYVYDYVMFQSNDLFWLNRCYVADYIVWLSYWYDVVICYMIVTLIIVQSNVILYYCITFDFRIRREDVRSIYHTDVSGHLGHRRCLCDSPAYLGSRLSRGVRVEHFSYPTSTRTRWCLTVPVPDPCRKLLPDPTRPAGIPVPVAYPYRLPLLGIIGLVA